EHGLGQYQILVQLPGVDDPARVKEIMQSTAMLEIKQVLGGPYTSEQEAITQQPNGILPPDSMLLKFNGIGRTSENSEEWYLVTRSSAVAGGGLCAGGGSGGRGTKTDGPGVHLTLANGGWRKMGGVTGAHG